MLTETAEAVTKKPEPTAEQVAADEMVRRAREQGLNVSGRFITGGNNQG